MDPASANLDEVGLRPDLAVEAAAQEAVRARHRSVADLDEAGVLGNAAEGAVDERDLVACVPEPDQGGAGDVVPEVQAPERGLVADSEGVRADELVDPDVTHERRAPPDGEVRGAQHGAGPRTAVDVVVAGRQELEAGPGVAGAEAEQQGLELGHRRRRPEDDVWGRRRRRPDQQVRARAADVLAVGGGLLPQAAAQLGDALVDAHRPPVEGQRPHRCAAVPPVELGERPRRRGVRRARSLPLEEHAAPVADGPDKAEGVVDVGDLEPALVRGWGRGRGRVGERDVGDHAGVGEEELLDLWVQVGPPLRTVGRDGVDVDVARPDALRGVCAAEHDRAHVGVRGRHLAPAQGAVVEPLVADRRPRRDQDLLVVEAVRGHGPPRQHDAGGGPGREPLGDSLGEGRGPEEPELGVDVVVEAEGVWDVEPLVVDEVDLALHALTRA